MLGARNLKDIILKAMDDIYRDLEPQIDKTNNKKIYVKEVVTCLRKSYYDRKNPIIPANKQKVSTIIRNGVRKSIKNAGGGEYNLDSNLSLLGHADAVTEDIVIRFNIVDRLPKVPYPQDLMDLNATLWILDRTEGVVVYITNEGKSVEFAITRDKKMFEETVRRVRVFNTLLEEEKVPIVEPSEMCLTCIYYERCYIQQKKYYNLTFEKLLGLAKQE